MPYRRDRGLVEGVSGRRTTDATRNAVGRTWTGQRTLVPAEEDQNAPSAGHPFLLLLIYTSFTPSCSHQSLRRLVWGFALV